MLIYFTFQFFKLMERTYFHASLMPIKNNILVTICICLNNTMHGSCWRNFQVRVGKNELFGAAKITPDTGSVDRQASRERQIMNRGERGLVGDWHVQPGRCMRQRHITCSSWNFKEYWNSSIVSVDPWSFQSHLPRGIQRAYSVLLYSRV